MSYIFSDEWGTYIGLDRILLPLEGFPAEIEALRLALYMAECSDATVHIIHIVEDSNNRESTYKKLNSLATEKASVMNVKIEIEEFHGGDAAQIILNKEDLCDLIIIGGKKRLREELFGSVSSTVIRRSRKPVVAVTSPVPSWEDLDKPLQKILVPVRTVEEDRAAMKLAAMLTSSATTRDFDITALHVVILPPTTPMAAFDDRTVKNGERSFFRQVGELSSFMLLPVTPQVLVGRHAERSIVKFGERYNVDLIILGERDKPGPFKRLLGAKSLYVARNASCAVAIIYKS